MKKNYSMRIASMLLVLVLLTTCVISGTFAKYVTSNSATDTAKVANWGVTITAEAWYDDQLEADLTSTENEIVTSASSDLLAPGTGVKFASINIEGKPEVAVKVTYAAELTLEGWTVAYDKDNNPDTPDVSEEYCPLVFVINGYEYSMVSTSITTIENFKAKIEEIIAGYSKQYTATEAIAGLDENSADELTVSCYWAYEGNDDVKDTALGDASTKASVTLKITCTVTQVN